MVSKIFNAGGNQCSEIYSGESFCVTTKVLYLGENHIITHNNSTGAHVSHPTRNMTQLTDKPTTHPNTDAVTHPTPRHPRPVSTDRGAGGLPAGHELVQRLQRVVLQEPVGEPGHHLAVGPLVHLAGQEQRVAPDALLHRPVCGGDMGSADTARFQLYEM